MLTGNLQGLDARLVDVITPIVRKHLSRFPMTFKNVGDRLVTFHDSRLPNNDIARLWVENNVFYIKSDLIRNNKYNSLNTLYTTRSTVDGRKMVSWLEQYSVPISPPRLPLYTIEAMSEITNKWRGELNENFENAVYRINTATFFEDMINHILTGTAPYSHPKIKEQNFNTREFAEKYAERKKRLNVKDPTLNVFINPDNTVVVNLLNTSGNHVMKNTKVSTGHNSMDTVEQSIKHKCAVLKMVDDQTYVPEIGVKISSNNFWVYE